MGILIRNGVLVTAGDTYRADILVEAGHIKAIGANLGDGSETVYDAAGKYIFPGGIDGHVHLAQTSSRGTALTDFSTTVAALAGGTTTVIAYATQKESTGILDSLEQFREEQIEGKSAVDVGMHAYLRSPNENSWAEFPALAEAGIPTVKLFMAAKGSAVHCDDRAIFTALRKAKECGMLVMVHAENSDLLSVLQQEFVDSGRTEPLWHGRAHPEVAEEEATVRAILLAKAAAAPLFVVHVSCADAMRRVREGRQSGVRVLAETCPHYLVLDASRLALPDFEGGKYVCSPPLRDAANQEPLWRALQEGWIGVVGSDHCAFNFHGVKDLGKGYFPKISNGVPGMQDRLHILYTYGVLAGKLSLNRMVDVWTTTPAKVFGLYPQKGSLAVGADADIVIFDPEYSDIITAASSLEGIDYALYEGFVRKGRAEKVFLRGELVMDQGKFVGHLGQGRFIRRAPFGSAYDAPAL